MSKLWWALLLLIGMGVHARSVGTERITVLTSPTPVLSEYDPADNSHGLSVDLAIGIIRQAQHDYIIRSQPFARTVRDTQEKPFSVSGIIARTPERENDFYWITPVVENQVVLYARIDSPLVNADVNLPDSLDTVAVMRNDFRSAQARSLNAKTIVSLNSWEQAVGAVIKGRIQTVLFSPAGLATLCQKQSYDCNQLAPVAHLPGYYLYLAMARIPANEALASKLKKAATEFKKSARYQQIMYKARDTLAKSGITATVTPQLLSLVTSNDTAPPSAALWVLADNLPYFVEPDGNGNLTGYSAYLVRDILDKAGISAPVLLTPWPRIIREINTKPNVMTLSLARTPAREHKFYWITPVTRSRHGLFGRSTDNTVPYDSLALVPKDRPVAVRELDYRADQLTEMGFTVLPFASWDEAIYAVLEGQAQWVYTSDARINVLCKQDKNLCNKLSEVAPKQITTTYIAVSRHRTDPTLIDTLRLAANEVKQSAQYAQWATDWSNKMIQVQHVPVHLDQGVVNLWPSKDHQ